MKTMQSKTLHPRNFHNDPYDFKSLIKKESSLKSFVLPNKYGNLSIDFANPNAVIALNKALLSFFYDIKYWQIPSGYLCPPIPGRADYIHYLADLLAKANHNNIPNSKQIKGLDVGIGANGIYSILANRIYNWRMMGSDIEKESLANVQNLIDENRLNDIQLKQQKKNSNIFIDIIKSNDKYDFTLCNPPFHKSKKEAQAGTSRKLRNLGKDKSKGVKLNFGGKSNELWCEGGEVEFIKNMILQSKIFEKNVFWFTSLVSKKENLGTIQSFLKKVQPFDIQIIEMKQGQKVSRFVAWTFLNKKEQKDWVQSRWLK